MADPLLQIENLHAEVRLRTGVARVLNGVTLSIRQGEVVGLVGESGAGKSVLAHSILNLLEPPVTVASGRVLFDGQDLLKARERELRRLRGNEISLIVPNPHSHLNPLISVGSQVANVIRAHRSVSPQQAFKESIELLAKVGIPDPASRAHSLPHEMSGGMAQRVVIVMALANSPRLIVADEPSSGLDVTVQLQILELLSALSSNQSLAMLLITRDLGIVAHFCHRVAIMYAGEVVEQAPVDRFFNDPRHPYSLELLRLASPRFQDTPRTGKGEPVVNPLRRPSGCVFHPRCLLAEERCRTEWPAADDVAKGHTVHCHFAQSKVLDAAPRS